MYKVNRIHLTNTIKNFLVYYIIKDRELYISFYGPENMDTNKKVLIAVQDSVINGAIKSCISNSKLEFIITSNLEDFIVDFNRESFTSIVIEDCFLHRNEFITAIKSHQATNEIMPDIFAISPNNEHIEFDCSTGFRFQQILTMCINNNLIGQLETVSELYNQKIKNKLLEQQRNEAQQKSVYLQTNNQDVIASELEKVAEQREEVEELNFTKSYYIARKSHALRNILHGILSFANIGTMKCDSCAPEKMKEFFRHIANSGQKLERILEELVYLSKLECNRIDFELVEHNIYKAIKQSADHQSSLLVEKNITVDIEMLMDNQRFKFDKEMIVMLFDNLISNAALHSDADKTIHVLFEDCDLGDKIPAKKIIIKDQGHGFSQPLDKVFEKYYIPENKDKMAPDAGLGLAICNEIVAKHNGKIEITNTGESGSIVEVTLPLEQPETTCAATSIAQSFSFDEEFTDYADDIEAVLNSEIIKPQQTTTADTNVSSHTESNTTIEKKEKKEKKEAESCEDLGANVDLF